MTYEDLLEIIDRLLLELIGSNIGEEAHIPIITGRLRSALKLKKISPTQWEIYMDDGGMSLEEWEELDYEVQQRFGFGFAPYAEKVNSYNPYMDRVWFIVYNVLKDRLTGSSTASHYSIND